LDNSEFVLSELDAAIISARGIDLISFIASGVVGLASLTLALATVIPATLLVLVRLLLLISTGVTVVFLFWLIRRLMRNRKSRLGLLRKWQQETFLARKYVDSLSGEKVRRMVELIQSLEDADVSRNPKYHQFDTEFMKMLHN